MKMDADFQGEDSVDRRIRELEQENSKLSHDLSYLNQMLLSIGFSQGLSSLKLAAADLLRSFEKE